MADQQLRQLEREFTSNPELGPQLLHLYRRSGEQEKYLKLRSQLGYAAEVSVLPIPTDEQTRAFVSYVAKAHSWYKHLSWRTPTPFYFFLNPHVMMICDYEPAKTQEEEFESHPKRKLLGFRPHLKENIFHYSERSTEDYRKSYGYWAYADERVDGIHSEICEKVIIPDNLRQIGSVGLTGHVYGDLTPELFGKEPQADNPQVQAYLMAQYQEERIREDLQQKMFQAMKNFLSQLQLETAKFR